MARRSTSTTPGATSARARRARSRRSRTTSCCRFAGDLAAADAAMSGALTPERIAAVVALIPDAWLDDEPLFAEQGRAPRRLRRLPRRSASPRRAHSQRRRPVPDRCTYDYAIVRVVPRVERGEFVNVGVIVSSDAEGYLAARFELDEARLRALDPHVDLNAGATRARGDPRGLRRRRRRRRDRPPLAARALPLAGRAAQHDHPDLGGAHRPLRRSRRRARSPRSTAWSALSTPDPP